LGDTDRQPASGQVPGAGDGGIVHARDTGQSAAFDGMQATVNLTLSMLSDTAGVAACRETQSRRAGRRLDLDAALGGEPSDPAHDGRW